MKNPSRVCEKIMDMEGGGQRAEGRIKHRWRIEDGGLRRRTLLGRDWSELSALAVFVAV
jgi:hypothetical protein